MGTNIIAAFCGTGKTFICEKGNKKAVEIEYWKYKDGLSEEYIKLIKEYCGKFDYVFISTDPEGLSLLKNEGFDITLVYPENSLRNEYLDRYINRDSAYEFIGTFMKNWNIWIDELKQQHFCKQIVLKSGQFLIDIL